MPQDQFQTRSERQVKRRRNERLLIILSILAILILVWLLVSILNKDEKDDPIDDGTVDSESTESVIDEQDESDIEVESEEEQDPDEQDQILQGEEDIVIQSIDSDDENVIEAYVGNWPVITTSQKEPHTTNFEDGSQDRIEIRQAILLVTNIKEEDLIELWIGNGGEQKVIASVKDESNGNIYRVYLTWVENEGWQATLVEKLKTFIKP